MHIFYYILFYITIVTYLFWTWNYARMLRDFHQTESNGFLEKGFRNSRNYIL